MSRKYKQVAPGEWVQPVRKGYKLVCCDCCLVHTLDFRLHPNWRGKFIQFRAFRDMHSTSVLRKREKITYKVKK